MRKTRIGRCGNPIRNLVTQIYEEFLKEPLGHKSHELLHTHYAPKSAKTVTSPVDAKH